jgi:hypothetical protein
MLVARRDPPFHGEGQPAPADFGRYTQPKAPRIVRFVTVMQMLGSLLAVPVGIASAYSFYRANFSPETTCQTLRSGIIALLDKGVDAGTRRILVRRDVEAFEKTCGTVDPEATAAFKTLLAAAPATVAPVAPQKVQRVEAPAKEPQRKVETHSQPPVRQVVPAPATATAVETARREPAVSDAQWLDAVREALVTHKPQPAEPQKAKPAPLPAPASAATPTSAPATVTPPSNPAPAPEAKLSPEAPAATLQPLPPAISIAPPAQQVDASHPVPPQVIPDTTGSTDTEVAKVEDHHRSRIGKWISGIPLLGSIVENGRQ